jgi:hypothetical protein
MVHTMPADISPPDPAPRRARPSPGHHGTGADRSGPAVDRRGSVLARRRVLGAGLLAGVAGVAGVGLTGCLGDGKPKAAKPDPLRPVLAGTVALRALFDATAARHPDLAARLTPLRADHDAHATALKAALTTPAPSASARPSPTPSVPAVAADALAALVTAEHQAQQAATKACLTAPASTATLLGSIAACRATHQAVLQ